MTPMNAPPADDIDIAQLIELTTSKVAPIWPLDRSIAVNPWWQQRQRSITEVAAEQQAWFKVPMLMNTEATEKGPTLVGSVAAMQDAEAARCGIRSLPWLTEIKQQMSQFCALWVSYPEQVAGDESHNERMYKQWLSVVKQDRGIQLLLNNNKVKKQLQALPNSYQELYQQALQLPLNGPQWQVYLHVLLHDLYGWASMFAQRRWQRTLEQGESFNDELNQLLAVRLAWDLVCWESIDVATREQFRVDWDAYLQVKEQVQKRQQSQWQRQHERELSYQQQLFSQLKKMAPTTRKVPKLQAIFCIDVRSEPMRRALEQQGKSIQTLGFAGFFGLPVEYQISQGYSKPQLPGLLAPSWQIQQSDVQGAAKKRLQIWRSTRWHRAHESPVGAYGWVEMSGITKAWKLFKRTISYAPQPRIANSMINQKLWHIKRYGTAATAEELAQLAANILKGMSLTQHFAAQILLVGHSASTHNNPHAASLDCGACGGQSGAANAQVLAQILNDRRVRSLLETEHGLVIPEATRFVPALHDTTLQELRLLSVNDDRQLASWLQRANTVAQNEQLQRLQPNSQQNARRELRRRAGCWAEVRPEWGLARNAALIFAPRNCTVNANFEARVFLHDYAEEQDPEQIILSQLLTAPMVVAHWINMQYYASTVAPQQFGSGNKLLHNVVADGLGVFEGNGGDLRIGLAKQSLHDGENWYHEPLRLTVVIAASQASIDRVIETQPTVKQLIDNQWLFLWQWDPNSAAVHQRTVQGWTLYQNQNEASK